MAEPPAATGGPVIRVERVESGGPPLGQYDEQVEAAREATRSRLALYVLAAVGAYAFLASAAFYFRPEAEAAKAIFEFVKIGVTPIAAVIVAHYFPRG